MKSVEKEGNFNVYREEKPQKKVHGNNGMKKKSSVGKFTAPKQIEQNFITINLLSFPKLQQNHFSLRFPSRIFHSIQLFV